MTLVSKVKTIEFGIQDEEFIKHLARDIGCYYSQLNERTYNLNRVDTSIQSGMGVFAWVHKEDIDSFWISTRKVWVEEARAKVLAGRQSSLINCFPKDMQHSKDSVSFDTKEGYIRTITVLKLIHQMN